MNGAGTGGSMLLRAGALWRQVAAVSALALVASLATLLVAVPASAATYGGFVPDGALVPDARASMKAYSDPSGAVQELGPVNTNGTKVGKIHDEPVSMMEYTNPTDNADLKNVWMDTAVDAEGIWLYFAWEREAAQGSGVVMYEFQQAARPTTCKYDPLDPAVIDASCNPWSFRDAGDFVLTFDIQGNDAVVKMRRWVTGAGGKLVLGPVEDLDADEAAAEFSADRSRGEAAINLSKSLFAPAPTSCYSIANVIPGTVVGNSDQADYKDIVFANTDDLYISNCGAVEVTKQTDPTNATGSFKVTASQQDGGAVRFDASDPSVTLTKHDETLTIADLIPGNDYRIAETVPAGWENRAITCGAVDVKAGGTFSVVAGQKTSCTVTNHKASPALQVTKTPTPTTFAAVNDAVSYSYKVENVGNVTLDGPFTITDDKTTAACPVLATLAPGASTTCTSSYAITQADMNAGQVTNRATASGSYKNSPVTSPQVTATVTSTAVPALSLTKSTSTPTYDATTDVLSYKYVLKNTGPLPITGTVSISDDKIAAVSCPAGAVTLGLLATVECTATSGVTQNDLDAGSITNKATGTIGGTTSNQSQVTVNALAAPALTIDKTSPTADFDAVGDVLTYSYLVTNTGNVTLPSVGVTDDKTAVTCPAGALAPKQSVTCSATYVVTQADLTAGKVKNVAYAHSGNTSSAPDDVTISRVVVPPPPPPPAGTPGLSLVKTPDVTTYDALGDVVRYSYLLTNTGNVTLSGPFTVADDKTTDESCPATASLAPGASLTCTSTQTIGQVHLDQGSITNTATGRGTYGGNAVVSAPDDATVTADQRPALGLVKVATDDTYAAVGDVVDYQYTVANTGNVTLAGPFSVDDDKVTVDCPTRAALAPGASLTCSAEHVVTQADLDAGSITNVATATNGTVTSPPATETVPGAGAGALAIDKTADVDGYDAVGDVITYTYVVTNAGAVTLAGPFTVDDDKTSTSCPSTVALAPGASLTCTATYVVTQADLDAGRVTNVARATNGTVTSPPDTVTVERTEVLPTVVPTPTASPTPRVLPFVDSPRQLPRTGGSLLMPLAGGSAMLLVGSLLVGAARARREES